MKYFFDVGTKKGIRTTTQNTHPDGMVHPHRIMKVHDILYCISGSMEVWQDGIPYEMNADDVLFLRAGAEHYGKSRVNREQRCMSFMFSPLRTT